MLSMTQPYTELRRHECLTATEKIHARIRHTTAGLRKEWQIHNWAGSTAHPYLPHPLTRPSPQFLITHKIPLTTVNCALQSKIPKPWSSLVCQLHSRHSRIMHCYSHKQMQDTRGAVAFKGTALWPVRKCCLL